MYKGLYDIFSHWFHEGKGQVWFYSDPHFGDDEMKYIRKNYIGDEEQIKRINSKLGKWDTLVILGDIGDINLVSKLKGYKVLIQGNHDTGANNYRKQRLLVKGNPNRCPKCNKSVVYMQDERDTAWCSSCGWVSPREDRYMDTGLFDEVYEGTLLISPKVLLSHEPVDYPYAYNIHGHDHSGWYSGSNHLNVCAEWINYTPICWKQIQKSGVLKSIPDIHRLTIDKASNKINKEIV